MKNFRDFGIQVPDQFHGDKKVICPNCSHTRKKKHEPCLSVNGDKGTWNCHNCGWSGSLNEHEPGTFPERERKVYRRPSPEAVALDVEPAILEYFRNRSISPATLTAGKVFSTVHYLAGTGKPTLCFAFPYFLNGELVNVKYRDARKNMTQEKDPEPCLYNIDACHEAETILITEGEIDTLSLIEAGYKTAVSVDKGAPNAKDADASKKLECFETCREVLDNAKTVVLVTDKDEPGLRLEKEIIALLGPQKCMKTAYPSDCKDINDVLVKYGPEGVVKVIESAEPVPVPGLHRFREYEEAVRRLYRDGVSRGLPTGWPQFDKIFSLKPGTLNIVTGYPGSGKSEFVDALAVNTVKNLGWKWAIFTPEMMPPARLFSHLAEKITGKSYFGRDRMTEEERARAMNMIDNAFYLIEPDDGTGMTLGSILDMIEVCAVRYGVKGAILDPWNWVEAQLPYGENMASYIGKQLQRCLRFARTQNIWFCIVAHPRKPEKDKKTGKYPVPTLKDISGTSEFDNKADYGLTVYREMAINANNHLTSVHVVKSRDRYVAVMNTMQEFRWDWRCGTFTDIDPAEEHRYDKTDCAPAPGYKD